MPGEVDRPFVLEQLINGGVVAALEMRKAGYPDRMEYREFCNVFWVLENGWRSAAAPRKQCEDLLASLIGDSSQYAFGFTKVFLRAGVMDQLRAALAIRRTRFAVVVQRRWRLLKGLEVIHMAIVAKKSLDKTIAEAFTMGLADCEYMLQVKEKTFNVQRVWDGLQEFKIDFSDLRKLKEDSQKLLQCSQRLGACRTQTEQLFAERLQAKQDELNSFSAKVAVIEEGLAASARYTAPGDEAERLTEELYVACQEACTQARNRLTEIVSKDLPELKYKGPEIFDLSMNYTVVDFAHKATVLLHSAATLVEGAEQRWKDFKGARFCFDHRTSGLQSQCAHARERLEMLNNDAPEVFKGENGKYFVGEDLTHGSYVRALSVLNEAWCLEARVDKLCRAGSDVENYEKSAGEFLTAVENAVTSTSQAQRERKEQLDEEERARKEAFLNALGSLSVSSQFKRHSALLVQIAAEIEEDLDQNCPADVNGEKHRILDKMSQLRSLMYDFGVTEKDAPKYTSVLVETSVQTLSDR
jgi:hypothetical protein